MIPVIIHLFDTPSYNVVVIEDNVINLPNLIKNTQPGGSTFLKTPPYCDTIRNHPVIFVQFFEMDFDGVKRCEQMLLFKKKCEKGEIYSLRVPKFISQTFYTTITHHTSDTHPSTTGRWQIMNKLLGHETPPAHYSYFYTHYSWLSNQRGSKDEPAHEPILWNTASVYYCSY